MNTRNQIALWTLPLAGVIGLIGVLLRGPYGIPAPDTDKWAAAAVEPVFTTAQILILIGYVLPFLGLWALYSYLRKQKHEPMAFWGFMLSVWGTALALPALGIAAFAGPLAARLYQAGSADAAQMIADALTGTGYAVSITSALCYIIGPALLGAAMWRSGTIPKWVGLLFALHGICLSLGFGMYPVLLIGWVMFVVSCGWLAARLRPEA